MAKKHISGADLSWLILEELSDPQSRASRISLAVVPDGKAGWRVVVANQSRRLLTAAHEQQLAGIQHRLRLVYELRLWVAFALLMEKHGAAQKEAFTEGARW